MVGFCDRYKRAARRALSRYSLPVSIKRNDGKTVDFLAVRRPPVAVEIGAGTAKNVFFATEWIVDGETFQTIRDFCGTNGLFNGEVIIDGGESYQLNRKTPYQVEDGQNASFRLFTIKMGATNAPA